jgi:type I restriction enzyme, R subunit
MTTTVSEKSLEDAIERALLAGGPDAPGGALAEPMPAPYAVGASVAPGGYHRRAPDDYDRTRCLLPRDVIDFVYATQPKTWERLKQHHGAQAKEKFLDRLAREIERNGVLHVLRHGIRDSGCKFELGYFPPASSLNEDQQTKHAANLFAVVRQLRYSEKNQNSLDVALFLNGIPLFTAELKNQFTGQDVRDAVRQYKLDRDPREPLFALGRCVAHFAVDPDLVYVSTQLAGVATRFLPFNRGNHGGAGNPPASPTTGGYATRYLWEQVWARDSVLDLLQHFVHQVEEEDDRGKKTGARRLIFPRYHQMDSVRRLVAHAREHGTGQRYLIQHSAGSGKSNSIAWLAHRLSVLHDAKDTRVFDSIIVITDRRVLDRQLQRTVRQFEQTLGVVENIDRTSRQLREALESGKTIIVTTLQKFPVIAREVSELPGKRFAVIVDEAHSSQSGESTKSLKAVLAAGSLEEAAREDEEGGDDLEDRIVAEMRQRGQQPNLSLFAFTATPKRRTLELFGVRRPDGRFEPFSLYSMRQAIEEQFILDVLQNYTTYRVYWSLIRKIADDPKYDREKAQYLLRQFVDLSEHAIDKKVALIVEHFLAQVAHRIGGRAKAMLVTRSRLHAVRYRLAVERYLATKKPPFRALVAFSGTVRDGGADYTEAGMNGFPDSQTAANFERAENRLLIVANKFQTGFDQPLLHTMYVDKRLADVNAVQTLSRLNRTHPEKTETMVLDFANEAQAIQEAFQPYYEKTALSEPTDPNLLYDLQSRLFGYHLFGQGEVDAFAAAYFGGTSGQDRLYALLAPVRTAFEELGDDERAAVRATLNDYARLYAFLSQVITYADADLEKLYQYARLLRRYLPGDPSELPRDVQENIALESITIRNTSSGNLGLTRGPGLLDPQGATPPASLALTQVEPLSEIIRELNERFGTDFTEEDKVFVRALEERLADDAALAASVRANPPESARLTFDHVVTDRLQDMVDTNFKFYKRVADDPAFAKHFLDWLFTRFRSGPGRSGT